MRDREIGIAEGVCTERSRVFSDKQRIHLIHEGSNKKSVEYCLDNKKPLCYLRAIQGHSGGFPIKPEMLGYTIILDDWKESFFQRRSSWDAPSLLGSGLIPGGKENDKSRQAVFFTPQPHDDNADPQKVHYKTFWKHNQDAVYWIKFPEPKIKDYNSGKRSHLRLSPMTLCQEIAFTE